MDDTRIVDENVQATERIAREIHHLIGSRGVHIDEIGLHGRRLYAEAFDGGQRVSRFMATVGQRDIGTGSGKAKGNALANARRTARDKGPASA